MPFRYEPFRYENTVTLDPLDAPPPLTYTTTTTADYTVRGTEPVTTYADFHIPKFITEEDLDYYLLKIFHIIEDHTSIDITEDEFMKLVKDDS